jgi:DNA-binding transcriptional MerR regulator
MVWSTREIAQLAGTTVRAVRYYHQVGLLEEPHRRSNGYKQYGVAHLVRTVRIRRLAELGFSLEQVAEMGEDDQYPHDALRQLDTELAQELTRLQQARTELGEILALTAPTDLPPGLASVVDTLDLSAADRSVIVVLSRLLDPDRVIDLLRVMTALADDGAARAFLDLDADADERTRQALAERLLPRALAVHALLPGLAGVATGSKADAMARRTIDQAVDDLYGPAQADVLRRVRRLCAAAAAGPPHPMADHPRSSAVRHHRLLPDRQQ